MKDNTISTFELFRRFPDAEAARLYFEGQRAGEITYPVLIVGNLSVLPRAKESGQDITYAGTARVSLQ